MPSSRKLTDIAVLAGLAPAACEALAADCLWRSFGKGQEILSAETESTDVFLVVSGHVRVTIYSPGGREVAFRDLGPGTSFGEISAIDGAARSASVMALDDGELAVLKARRFWQLIEAHPVVAANVMKALVGMIRDLTARVVETTTMTVPVRVRADVLRRARAAGVERNRAQIAGFPTHAELASQIGATREAVSRELSRMAGEGLVERKGRDLIVHDLTALGASLEHALDG